MSAFQEGFQNALGPYQMAKQGIDEGTARRKQAGLGGLMADYAAGGAPDYQGIAANGGNPLAVRQDADGQKEHALQELGQMAGYLAALPDGNTRAQAFQSMRTKLDPLGQSLGLPPLPPQWDESHLPELQALAQQFGGAKGADPESFSNGGQGFLIGNRGTVRPIDGYADQAGQIAQAQAQARGQAQAQYRAPPKAPGAGRAGPSDVMAERRQTLAAEIYPGLEAELGAKFTPDMRQQVAAQYLGTGKFTIADPKAKAGAPGGPMKPLAGAQRVQVAMLDAAEAALQKYEAAVFPVGKDGKRSFDRMALHVGPAGGQIEEAINNVLRVESGAAVPDSEVESGVRRYGATVMNQQDTALANLQQLKDKVRMVREGLTKGNPAEAPGQSPANSSKLNAQEQAELEQLRARFGKK